MSRTPRGASPRYRSRTIASAPRRTEHEPLDRRGAPSIATRRPSSGAAARSRSATQVVSRPYCAAAVTRRGSARVSRSYAVSPTQCAAPTGPAPPAASRSARRGRRPAGRWRQQGEQLVGLPAHHHVGVAQAAGEQRRELLGGCRAARRSARARSRARSARPPRPGGRAAARPTSGPGRTKGRLHGPTLPPRSEPMTATATRVTLRQTGGCVDCSLVDAGGHRRSPSAAGAIVAGTRGRERGSTLARPAASV